jgi:hypothetical protein
MAYGNVPAESPGNVAQSSRYNQLVTNVDDLDTRLDIVEARTIDTSGAVGIGNQRLSDRLGAGVTNVATADARFGAGVGTGSNVTTGSAASQLTDLRSRATALESVTTNVSTGNSALGTRMTAAESAIANGTSGNAALNTRLAVIEGRPIVEVTLTADVALLSTTETAISWSSAPRNTFTMWSAGNPTRLTVPAGQGGLYLVGGGVCFQNNGTGGRTVHLRVNGAGNLFRAGSTPGIATIHSEMSVCYPMILAAGDYVEVMVWQNSGVTLNVLGTVGSGYDPSARIIMTKLAA